MWQSVSRLVMQTFYANRNEVDAMLQQSLKNFSAKYLKMNSSQTLFGSRDFRPLNRGLNYPRDTELVTESFGGYKKLWEINVGPTMLRAEN